MIQKKLSILNEITHPEIFKLTKKLSKKNGGVVFIEIPLLFLRNFTEIVDKTLVIYADEKEQVKRLRKRNNISKDEAINLINKQMSINEKVKLAIYIDKVQLLRYEIQVVIYEKGEFMMKLKIF